MDLPEQVEIKGGHPIVISDTGEKVHQNKLAVPLAAVPGLFVSGSLRLRSTFDNNDSRSTTTGDS